MKRILTLALALILCVGCFTGCFGGKKTGGPSGDATVVTIWSTEAGAQAVWKELVDNWNNTTGKEKNIYIDFQVATDGQKVNVAIQNDSLPNIFTVSGTQLKKLILSEQIMALNDMPGGEEFLKEFGQAGESGKNLKDGKQYSVYANVRTAGLIINEDLFKKAGIVDKKGNAKAPKTISEMKDAAKKIAALGDDYYGFIFPLRAGLGYTIDYQTSTSFERIGKENAASYIDLDKQEVHYDGYKDRYQWLLDWKKDDEKNAKKKNYGGLLFPGALEMENDPARSYFLSGTIGMFPAISWDVGVYTTQFVINSFDWKVVEFPLLDGHEHTGNYWNQRGGSFLIGKTAANKSKKDLEATMEVYKFLFSLEVRKTMFERGMNISGKTDVLESVDKSKLHPQFLKFAEFVDEDRVYVSDEAYVLEGESWKVLFEKVWQGNLTLDAAIKDYEKRSTEALRKAIKDGKYDVERQKRVNQYIETGDTSIDVEKKWD